MGIEFFGQWFKQGFKGFGQMGVNFPGNFPSWRGIPGKTGDKLVKEERGKRLLDKFGGLSTWGRVGAMWERVLGG